MFQAEQQLHNLNEISRVCGLNLSQMVHKLFLLKSHAFIIITIDTLGEQGSLEQCHPHTEDGLFGQVDLVI